MLAVGDPEVVVGVVRLQNAVARRSGPDGEDCGGASGPLGLPDLLDGGGGSHGSTSHLSPELR